MRRTGIVAFALALAVVSGLTGCGGADTPPGVTAPTASSAQASSQPAGPATGPGTMDACALVTAAEVSAALGTTVPAGTNQPGGLPGQQTCAFGAEGSVKLATVAVVPGDAHLFDRLRTGLGAGAQDVSGLGDRAVRDGGYMNVLKSGHVLILFVSGLGSGAEALAALKALATAALARLN